MAPQPANPLKNLEAERALLSTMLFSPSLAGMVKSAIPAMCLAREEGVEPLFSEWAHQEIFEAILFLAERDGGCDLVTLGEELDRRGRYRQVGGGAFLATIAEEVLSTIYAPEYVRIVFEKWQARQSAALAKLYADAKAEAKPEISARMKLVESMRHGADFEHFAEQNAEWLTMFEQRRVGGHRPGIPTGMADLDRITEGARPGQLWVFAARPGMGKSVCLLTLAENAARRGHAVYYRSMEMTKEEVLARLYAMKSGVSLGVCLNPWKATPGQTDAIHAAAERVARLPLTIHATGGAEASDVGADAKRAVDAGYAKMVVVDYLQLLKFSRAKAAVERVAHSARAMKELAMDCKVPVIVGSQVRRDVEQRQPKKRRRGDSMPRLSDLAESSEVENASDVVVMLHRHGAESPPPAGCEDFDGETLFSVAKHRNGRRGFFSMRFNPETVTFDAPPMGYRSEL